MSEQDVPGLGWLTGSALPLWAGVGWDDRAGLFVERLDLAGRAVQGVPRRVMVQARQIFVMSVAHRRGWSSGARAPLERAAEGMVRLFHAPDGRPGWVFSVDDDGRVVDPTRDLYAHAFVLLALACTFRTTGERAWLDLADETLAFLDDNMADAAGGYRETWPEPKRPRRQNPHMHLFEALLSLHEADGKGGYLNRAKRLLHLAESRFVLGAGPSLVEFFADDWTPVQPGPFTFEPGHHFEWVWLLEWFEKLGGGETAPLAARLLEAALRSGIAGSGLAIDEAREDGTVVQASTRLWPQTEAAKAMTTDVARGMGAPAPSAFLEVLHRHFLAPAFPGSWIDHLSPTGEPLSAFAPASSLYHIVCAYDVVARYAGAAEPAGPVTRTDSSGETPKDPTRRK